MIRAWWKCLNRACSTRPAARPSHNRISSHQAPSGCYITGSGHKQTSDWPQAKMALIKHVSHDTAHTTCIFIFIRKVCHLASPAACSLCQLQAHVGTTCLDAWCVCQRQWPCRPAAYALPWAHMSRGGGVRCCCWCHLAPPAAACLLRRAGVGTRASSSASLLSVATRCWHSTSASTHASAVSASSATR